MQKVGSTKYVREREGSEVNVTIILSVLIAVWKLSTPKFHRLGT